MGEGSVFWHITKVEPDRDVESLIEIEADGSITREIDIAADGTPTRITRPGEYGEWNDSSYPVTPISSPGFQEEWGAIGSELSRDEFEAIYARADALLPQSAPLSRSETMGFLLAIVVAVVVVVVFLKWVGLIG